MANVVKLVNGGAIHVRTGVIQGIGPIGPRGVQGNQGPQGEQGPVGETGPMGQILQQHSLSSVAPTNNVLGADTDTVIAFGSIDYDELGCFVPTTGVLLDPGLYLLSCWLRFDATPPKPIAMWFATAGTFIAAKSAQTDASNPAYLDLSFPFKAEGGEVINVLARSGSATNVSLGAWAVNRIGSGPQGVPGPVGPQGAVGATGATGATGPAGSPGGAYPSYNTLVGH